MKKRLLAIIVNFILIFTNVIPVAMAVEDQTQNYLALGDSITFGYGLDDIDTQSYAQIVRKKYNINEEEFRNMAVSGMTCAEFYEIIQTKEYTEAIKKANLITVSIGSNELLKVAIEAISDCTGISSTDADFEEKVKEYFLNLGYLEKIQVAYKLYSYFTSEETKQLFNNSINTYKEKWKESVKYIKEINSDINIVAIEFYNPYYEVGLASYDLGSFTDEFIQKMNNELHQQSKSEKEYKIAKIYNDFNTTNPRITNVNIDFNDFSKINIDPHPNKDGHSIIATRVLDALKSISNNKKDIKELYIQSISDFEYTGKEIKPKVLIKNNENLLEEDTDFSVTYINNVEVGQAEIIIKGIGKYTGSVIKTFNIKNPETVKQINVEELNVQKVENQIYTGIGIYPDVEIKIADGTKLIKDKDYLLRYQDNIEVGTATIEIVGVGNYTGIKNINFIIIPKDLSSVVISEVFDQQYTGARIEPKIQITNGSIELIKDKDYDLRYDNNLQVGEGIIIIEGKGNYTGSVTKKFNIIEKEPENIIKNINEFSVSDIEDKVYTGKVITPEIIIKDSDKTLIKDRDYQLSFFDNVEVGVGTVVITGIGNYAGTVYKKFNIIKKDINYTRIDDIQDIEKGSDNTEIEITSDSVKLNEGEDYIIENDEVINEKTEKITIKGINNYSGKTTKTVNYLLDNSVEREDNISIENKDKTVAKDILPYAGNMKYIIILLLFMVINGIFLYHKYNKNRDIN